MPSYLGPLGALAPIHMVASLSNSAERPTSYQTTLGGNRYAQVGPRVHRQWSVSTEGARPDEVAQLQAFVEGEFGLGPWWWVDSWAHHHNILPPHIASLEQPWRNTVHGGPVRLSDGSWAGRSLISSADTTIDEIPNRAFVLPVVPGIPVTASAWLTSTSQTVRIQVRDSNEDVLASASTTVPADGLRRVSTTITAVPNGAYDMVVRFPGTGRIVRPAVSWTARATPYGPGGGCESAHISTLSRDPIHESMAGSSRLTDSGFTIVEVGPDV